MRSYTLFFSDGRTSYPRSLRTLAVPVAMYCLAVRFPGSLVRHGAAAAIPAFLNPLRPRPVTGAYMRLRTLPAEKVQVADRCLA